MARVIDKSGWTDGPWNTEPDEKLWRTHAGFDGLIRRQHHGALCGYVRIPSNHVDYERSYDGIDLTDGVHGGLTFSGRLEEHKGYWVGFDCCRGWDIAPAYDGVKYMANNNAEYRDFAYVTEQVESLAMQLAGRYYA